MWNYSAIFKGIIFKLRIEFEIELVFWFEEGKTVLVTEVCLLSRASSHRSLCELTGYSPAGGDLGACNSLRTSAQEH